MDPLPDRFYASRFVSVRPTSTAMFHHFFQNQFLIANLCFDFSDEATL